MVGSDVAIRRLRYSWMWGAAAAASAAIAGVAAAVVGPTAALLAIAGVMAAVVFARMPGVLLAAYLLIPVYKGFAQPYSPIDLTVTLAGLNMLQAIPLVIDGRLPRVSRLGIALWVALAGLVLFGVLYAPNQGLALSRAANYWVLVFLALLPPAIRVASTPKFVRQFLWTFYGVGVLTVLLGLVSLKASQRLTVFEADTIDTARVALLVPLLGVALVWRVGSPLLRCIAIILIPAAIIVAIATGSRGPLLILVVLSALAIVRAIVEPRSADWRVMSLAAGVAFVLVFVISVAAPDLPTSSTGRITQLGQALESSLSGGAYVPSDQSRLTLYGYAVSLFEEQPLIGNGTASYSALSIRDLGPQGAAAYPHNALLQFAAEYGLLGLMLFVGIVLLALVRKQARGSTWSALRWLFMFFLLNAMVSGNILEERALWGLLLLLVMAADVQPVSRCTGESRESDGV